MNTPAVSEKAIVLDAIIFVLFKICLYFVGLTLSLSLERDRGFEKDTKASQNF
jgi:hypothetical protein